MEKNELRKVLHHQPSPTLVHNHTPMKVTILGNNSALPAFGRHPTSQAVTIGSEIVLIDCGEGTQNRMQRFGIKWRSIHHIFISHLHGDHYFGLPGLLNSMSLLGRTAPCHLYAPAELEDIIMAILRVADTTLSYTLHFHALPPHPTVLFEDQRMVLKCFPVEHRIACWGLLLEAKTRGRRIAPEKCAEFGISPLHFESLKAGADYVPPEGKVVKNEWVTEPGPKPKKYAYCADTVYTKSYLETILGADAVYHECTYLDADREKAKMRFHCTAVQAAQIALEAETQLLLLGHFSSKYRELDPFREEAAAVFPNAVIAVEGMTYDI